MKTKNKISKKFNMKPISRLMLLGCVSVLAACGGGSDDSSSLNTNTQARSFKQATLNVDNLYAISGTLTGLLPGSSIELLNNEVSSIIVDKSGKFMFPAPVAGGGSYDVIIKKMPSGQTCTVVNGKGDVKDSDINTVQVLCGESTFSELHNFNNSIGENPTGGLIQDDSGTMYGTTLFGDFPSGSIIYKITPDGVRTDLYQFDHGLIIKTELVLGTDGNLYGIAENKRDSNDIIFKLNLENECQIGSCKMTPLHSFNQSIYAGALVEVDGNFYGVTERGGDENKGTVYKITPEGKFNIIHSFKREYGDAAYRYNPNGQLLAVDGLLYGRVQRGMFSITLDGKVSFYNFDTISFSSSNTAPLSSDFLEKGSDGNIYGVMPAGGRAKFGAIYQFNPKDKGIKLVFDFADTTNLSNPNSVRLSKDGRSFYGISKYRDYSIHDQSNIFMFTLGEDMSTLETLYSMGEKTYDGERLLVDKHDNLYGLISQSEKYAEGAVYKFGS